MGFQVKFGNRFSCCTYKNRDSAHRNLPFRFSGFGEMFSIPRPNVFQAGVNKFSGSGKMIFRSMKSTFRVRGKCFSGCCEMNFRSVENSFQGAGNYFQTRGQTTPARVPCGCPGPRLGGKVVYIKNYIIFSNKNTRKAQDWTQDGCRGEMVEHPVGEVTTATPPQTETQGERQTRTHKKQRNENCPPQFLERAFRRHEAGQPGYPQCP